MRLGRGTRRMFAEPGGVPGDTGICLGCGMSGSIDLNSWHCETCNKLVAAGVVSPPREYPHGLQQPRVARQGQIAGLKVVFGYKSRFWIEPRHSTSARTGEPWILWIVADATKEPDVVVGYYKTYLEAKESVWQDMENDRQMLIRGEVP